MTVDVKMSYRLELDAAEVRLAVLALRGELKKDEDKQAAREMAARIDDRRAETHRRCLEALSRTTRDAANLKQAVGKWPGDETDEEINQALKEMS